MLSERVIPWGTVGLLRREPPAMTRLSKAFPPGGIGRRSRLGQVASGGTWKSFLKRENSREGINGAEGKV